VGFGQKHDTILEIAIGTAADAVFERSLVLHLTDLKRCCNDTTQTHPSSGCKQLVCRLRQLRHLLMWLRPGLVLCARLIIEQQPAHATRVGHLGLEPIYPRG